MTTKEELRQVALNALCIYDPRSPSFVREDDDEEQRIPRRGCACDKCFYGKDAIALDIIAYLEADHVH